jgi:Xaa-Pro aminopeptidase
MVRGSERIVWITEALQDAGLDALVCTLPTNVLMLSGYWPVVGSAVAAATRDGRVAVLAPTDEHELATEGWAMEVRTYEPSALSRLTGPAEAVRDPLGRLLRDLDMAHRRIGYEDGHSYEQCSYAAMFLYQAALPGMLTAAAPDATRGSGMAAITRLRSRLAGDEVAQVRRACQIAHVAFTAGAQGLRPGLHEPEVAAAFATGMSVGSLRQPGSKRAGAFTFCMSGPNAATAKGAYARTRDRELRAGDFVLVHCNSYLDGYWTDITRTYSLGEPDARQRALYDAVFAARTARSPRSDRACRPSTWTGRRATCSRNAASARISRTRWGTTSASPPSAPNTRHASLPLLLIRSRSA